MGIKKQMNKITYLTVAVGLNLLPTLSFASEPDSLKHLGEVVVTGTRTQTDSRHLPQTVTVVEPYHAMPALYAYSRENILPTLTEQVPGLMVTSRGMMGYGVSGGAAGGMMLRGISSGAGQIMVLIDGHPQYNGVYGHSIADSYQTMMIDRVEVLRGPASMLYGSNAMGGVVNIVTRKPEHSGVVSNMLNVGIGSYGTLQVDASNEIQKDRFSSVIAGQYGRSENHRPNMGFEQYGGYAKLNYDMTDKWNAYADIDITHFNASNPGTVTDPMFEADQWITRGAVAVGIENHYEKTSGRISFYDNFGRHKINDGYKEGGSPQERLFRSKDALMGVSMYQGADLWEGGRVTVGFDYQGIYGHTWYTNRETGKEEENGPKQSADVNNTEIAGYADIRQDISSWLTVDAGARYDHHSVTGGVWVPQGGIVIRPTNNRKTCNEIKLMASKGFRNPTMKEMYLYPPSNEELEPERMWTYELSWRQRLNHNKVQYGINFFVIDADNIIQTINRKNINTGKIKNYGIECDAKWYVMPYMWLDTNHSWLHMDNPVVSAPQYKGYIGLNWYEAIKTGLNISCGLMQVCGLYTAVGQNETKESFTLLNATVSRWIDMAGFKFEAWVNGENLLAQKYEYVMGMPMPRATFKFGVRVPF